VSILKQNCHLIAIWALLHFPGCERETAGSQPYTTFRCPSGAHNLAFPGLSEARDLAFLGPLSTHVIRYSRAPLELSEAPGPVNLLPLLPPVQGTVNWRDISVASIPCVCLFVCLLLPAWSVMVILCGLLATLLLLFGVAS
jgi:hypothetical protein